LLILLSAMTPLPLDPAVQKHASVAWKIRALQRLGLPTEVGISL
jgi:hypothetical protein